MDANYGILASKRNDNFDGLSGMYVVSMIRIILYFINLSVFNYDDNFFFHF